jgi:ABC-type glycerol-3-phosphate transport system substrate-binding protein
MRYRNLAQLALAGLALSGAIAACGSSGSGGSGSSSPSAHATPTHAASGGAAAAQIKANWVAFFNAKTPVAKRVSLLQNGKVFEPIIKEQSGSGLASSVSATVARVTDVTAAQAKVTYTILLAGSPVLRNRTGVAVKEGGVWKVGDASFCGLLSLQNAGSTTSLPSACSKT